MTIAVFGIPMRRGGCRNFQLLEVQPEVVLEVLVEVPVTPTGLEFSGGGAAVNPQGGRAEGP